MRYIQSNLIFYGFTISFHHSKEVFVCCLIVSLRCVFWVGLSIQGGGGIDSPRPASQRAAAFILTAAMLTTLAAPAFAGTWYIENGDITVKAGDTEGTNKVKQGDSDFVRDEGDTIITGTSNQNTVTIDTSEGNVDVTFGNLNIDASSGNEAAVSVTGKGDTNIELDGDNHLTGGNGRSGISSSGSLTISGGETDRLTAQGGSGTDGSGGRGIFSKDLTISGGTVNANGGNGNYGNGGDGILSFNHVAISGGTVNANGGNSDYSNGGDGIRSLDHVAISGGTVKSNGGSGTISGGNGIISNDIDLSGSLELTAKAGSPNGKALSRVGSELDLNTIKDKLDPGAKVTATDADGKVIQQVSIPRPVEPEEPSSSSDGGSSAPSAPASSLPGLTVTDKDGQRISYTSIRGNNVLSLRVGRFTASLRASLSTLRQLRAEGIDTITFQTILCSTTLSVDELLAMGGEDAEIVLTHHIRSSTLTVGGKAV